VQTYLKVGCSIIMGKATHNSEKSARVIDAVGRQGLTRHRGLCISVRYMVADMENPCSPCEVEGIRPRLVFYDIFSIKANYKYVN